MKFNILLSICFLFLINSCYIPSPAKPVQTWEYITPIFKERSVRLYTVDINNIKYYHGAGVIYNKNTVLTSAHLYTRSNKKQHHKIVVCRPGTTIQHYMQILKKDSARDGLMLLGTTDDDSFSGITQTLSLGRNIDGSEACLYSNSKYFFNIPKYGHTALVSNINDLLLFPAINKFDYINFIFLDINSTIRGNSGSPIYNIRGQLVGIYWGKISYGQQATLNCAVAVDNIKTFIYSYFKI